MKKKLICFDYDGTYTDFPELMDTVLRRANMLDYRCILCTMRYPDEEDMYIASIADKFEAVYFTGRLAKQPYLKELGIEPDLWIDDEPKWIVTDAIKTDVEVSPMAKTEPNYKKLLKRLLMIMNPVTAAHRHGTPICTRRLDDLCNEQIIAEEQIGGL
jgi:hydroxymethylpyrimidine pyrophosphatase-like HAD family hydrolase